MHVNGNSHNPRVKPQRSAISFGLPSFDFRQIALVTFLNLDICSRFPINSFGTRAVMCNNKHDTVVLVDFRHGNTKYASRHTP
jgi:hypothetical protein